MKSSEDAAPPGYDWDLDFPSLTKCRCPLSRPSWQQMWGKQVLHGRHLWCRTFFASSALQVQLQFAPPSPGFFRCLVFSGDSLLFVFPPCSTV